MWQAFKKILAVWATAILLLGSFAPLSAYAGVTDTGADANPDSVVGGTVNTTDTSTTNTADPMQEAADAAAAGNATGDCTSNNGVITCGNDQVYNANTDPNNASRNPNSGILPKSQELSCGISSIDICITQLVYIIAPGLANGVAFIMAYFFDIVVRISLTSSTYALDFLAKGWGITRAVANIAFLLILIYIAVVVMLEAETANTTRMLASFIIMALLVNFSFFVSRVVIDGGNILATQFYNATAASINSMNLQPTNTNSWLGNQTTDLTAPIMNAVAVQGLLSQEKFSAWRTNNGMMTSIIVVSLLYICVAIVYYILAAVFLMVGVKFLLRIINLWFSIVIAPIAFAAHVLTNNSLATKIYRSWQNSLVQYAFYPAAFLFIFYILTLMIIGIAGQTGLIDGLFGALSGTENLNNAIVSLYTGIGSVMIKMGIIIALLYYGLKLSDSIAEGGTSIAQNISGKAVGFASGTAARFGRGTIGWGAYRAANSNFAKRKAAEGGMLSRTLWRGADKLSRSSFDVRNSTAAKAGMRGVGINAGTPKDTQASYARSYQANVDARKVEAKKLKPSELQKEQAQQKALNSLSSNERAALEQNLSAYNQAYANHQTYGTRDTKEKLAAARKMLRETRARDAQGKDVNVLEKIDKQVKAETGADNVETYADSIEKRSWRNGFGVLSPGVPGFISRSDKDAAQQLRQESGKGDKEFAGLARMLNVAKAQPQPQAPAAASTQLPPRPATNTPSATATTAPQAAPSIIVPQSVGGQPRSRTTYANPAEAAREQEEAEKERQSRDIAQGRKIMASRAQEPARNNTASDSKMDLQSISERITRGEAERKTASAGAQPMSAIPDAKTLSAQKPQTAQPTAQPSSSTQPAQSAPAQTQTQGAPATETQPVQAATQEAGRTAAREPDHSEPTVHIDEASLARAVEGAMSNVAADVGRGVREAMHDVSPSGDTHEVANRLKEMVEGQHDATKISEQQLEKIKSLGEKFKHLSEKMTPHGDYAARFNTNPAEQVGGKKPPAANDATHQNRA